MRENEQRKRGVEDYGCWQCLTIPGGKPTAQHQDAGGLFFHASFYPEAKQSPALTIGLVMAEVCFVTLANFVFKTLLLNVIDFRFTSNIH